MSITKRQTAILWLLVVCFVAELILTAWVCDDAYITFRTIDNFLSGHGLTWNTGERVQAYTHPLWMILSMAAFFLTRDFYFSTLILSFSLSIVTFLLIAFRVSRSAAGAIIALVILLLSKVFIDFSTSGLENPLTHFLLVLFLILYFSQREGLRALFLLALIACAMTLNRMDSLLLPLPVLVAVFWRRKSWNAALVVALAFVPLALWEIFSIVYYGFPFPNTAYAKLFATGVPFSVLILKGLYYLWYSFSIDPLTLPVVLSGVAIPFLRKDRLSIPVAVGVALYLLYVLRIGGDFMAGRFFTAPLICAVALIARLPFASFNPRWVVLVFLVVIGLGLSHPASPIYSNFNYGTGIPVRFSQIGIVDERGIYYPATGLLRDRDDLSVPDSSLSGVGMELRMRGLKVHESYAIGYEGYFAGPGVHIIDINGLGDPLMARILPAASITEPENYDGNYKARWISGHLKRTPPVGYKNTITYGENMIRDLNLAAYYEKLTLITRGRLFDRDRWAAIWNMNIGAYDHLLDAYHESVRRQLEAEAEESAGPS